MKHVIVGLFLFTCIGINYAQETQSLTPTDKKLNVSFYFGAGMQYTDALEINPFLSESNVPTVRRFPFEFSFGFMGDFGKNRVDLDFGFYNQEREENNFGHQVNSANFTLRYLRNIIQFENKDRFYAGLALSYLTSELEFFDKNSTVDLEDPGDFGEVAKLDNTQFLVGPSIGYSFYSSSDDEESLRIQLTYDINVSSNDWDSNYARVSNSIEETGNRLRLQLILPF